MEESYEGVPVRKKWLRLGLILAVLHSAFLLLVLLLLQVDVYLAVVIAAGVSVAGGVAIVVFVLYLY